MGCQRVHGFVNKWWFWFSYRHLGLTLLSGRKSIMQNIFKQLDSVHKTRINAREHRDGGEEARLWIFLLVRGFSCHCLLPETALCILIKGAVLNPLVLWCDNYCIFSFYWVGLGGGGCQHVMSHCTDLPYSLVICTLCLWLVYIMSWLLEDEKLCWLLRVEWCNKFDTKHINRTELTFW